MNESHFTAILPDNTARSISAAAGGKETIDALCEKAQEHPEIMARISQVQGLYHAFELTASPAVVDAMVWKLGSVIEDLLQMVTYVPADEETARREEAAFRLYRFQESLREQDSCAHMKEWIDGYIDYLLSQGKSTRTIKIYKGKIAAAFPELEDSITPEELEQIFTGLLDKFAAAPKKDHNMTSAIRGFLTFLAEIK